MFLHYIKSSISEKEFILWCNTWWLYLNLFSYLKMLAWLLLQSLTASEKIIFVQIWGGEKLLEKCRWEILKQRERGLTIFRTCFEWFFGSFLQFSDMFRMVFRILFRVFQNIFSSNLNIFLGGSFVLQTCRPKKMNCFSSSWYITAIWASKMWFSDVFLSWLIFSIVLSDIISPYSEAWQPPQFQEKRSRSKKGHSQSSGRVPG